MDYLAYWLPWAVVDEVLDGHIADTEQYTRVLAMETVISSGSMLARCWSWAGSLWEASGASLVEVFRSNPELKVEVRAELKVDQANLVHEINMDVSKSAKIFSAPLMKNIFHLISC